MHNASSKVGQIQKLDSDRRRERRRAPPQAVEGQARASVSPELRQREHDEVCRPLSNAGHAANRLNHLKIPPQVPVCEIVQNRNRGKLANTAPAAADADQLEQARSYVAQLASTDRFRGREIATAVEPAGPFHEAEAEHQDYYARNGGSCSV